MNSTPATFLKISFLLFFVIPSITTKAQTIEPKAPGLSCEGYAINFTANSTVYDDWTWDFGDGSMTSGSTPQHRDPVHYYTRGGTYTVKLTAKRIDNKFTPIIKAITIVIKPSPIANLKLLTKKEQCFEGNSFCFADESTPVSSSYITQRKFIISDGTIYDSVQNLEVFCHKIKDSSGGTFDITITLEDANGCVSKVYLQDYIKVYPAIQAKLTIQDEQIGDSILSHFTNETHTNWLNDQTSIPLKDVASFEYDLGDTIITGDSTHNVVYWKGANNDGKLDYWYKKKVNRVPKLTVSSKYGCKDSTSEKVTDSLSQLHLRKHTITGKSYFDKNGNCTFDAGDSVILAKIEYFPGVIKLGGNAYEVQVLDSTTIRIKPSLSDYEKFWTKSICPSYYDVMIHDSVSIDTSGFDFAIQYNKCPTLTIRAFQSRRRRCITGETLLTYQNLGSGNAENVRIKANISREIIVKSVSHSYSIDSDGAYIFDLGTIKGKSSGVIRIYDSIPCSGPQSQRICTQANIYASNACKTAEFYNNPIKDSSKLVLTSTCDGDSKIRYKIENVGGKMEGYNGYYIFMEDGISNRANFTLKQNDSLIIKVPSQGGRSQSLAILNREDQLGKTLMTTIDGCGNNGTLVGESTMFSNPFNYFGLQSHNSCSPILNSYDPNDKTVFPAGLSDQHAILKNTPLEYLIRFQNTGNDTAYKVVITDDLDSNMDIASFSMGPSSHDCDVEVNTRFGHQKLIFTFNNINLLDSATNPVESQGFVTYYINPKSTIRNHNKIENKAQIYFDFNEPIVTNTTFLTIEDPLPEGDPITIYQNDTLIQFVSKQDIKSCDSILSPSKKTHWTTSANYRDTIFNPNGADSIFLINADITLLNNNVTFKTDHFELTETNASVQWYTCTDGFVPLAGETNRTFYPSQTGNYAAILSKNNCYDTTECLLFKSASIGENQLNYVKIYPNPTSGIVSFKPAENLTIKSLIIRDLTGKVIQEILAPKENIDRLDLSSNSDGLYFVQIIFDDHQSVAFKIQKLTK